MPVVQESTELLKSLVAFPSVSSTSNRGVSDAIHEHLERLGFEVERTTYFDARQTEKVNLVARRDPTSAIRESSPSGLAYFCHTDVVPAEGWTGPGGDPFCGVIEEDRLYGRGSCDMKGSLVAMLDAVGQISADQQNASLWIICTADEEVGFEGAKHLVKHSDAYRGIVQAQPLAIIGEPTGMGVVHAHKGIVGLQVISRGRAAHSSTRDGVNANVAMVPMLQTLHQIHQRLETDTRYFDERFDPPSLSWNFGVSDGSSAVNITPEQSTAWASFRPMPEVSGEDLIDLIARRAADLGLEFKRLGGGGPFWIDPDTECVQRLCELTGGSPRTVCYGTDGGEFDELRQRVVCGPGDIAQAHTTDEWIALPQLALGTKIYGKAIRKWCLK